MRTILGILVCLMVAGCSYVEGQPVDLQKYKQDSGTLPPDPSGTDAGAAPEDVQDASPSGAAPLSDDVRTEIYIEERLDRLPEKAILVLTADWCGLCRPVHSNVITPLVKSHWHVEYVDVDADEDFATYLMDKCASSYRDKGANRGPPLVVCLQNGGVVGGVVNPKHYGEVLVFFGVQVPMLQQPQQQFIPRRKIK